jgi:antitoxin ParD1/3/4
MKVGSDFGKQKGTRPPYKLAALKAEIDRGMADVTEGRLTDFDPRQIIALGRRLSAERAKSVSPKKQK